MISSIKIIGTISFGGKTKASSDTLEAEKPKPLKPLTIEANKITNTKKISSSKLKLAKIKYSILF